MPAKKRLTSRMRFGQAVAIGAVLMAGLGSAWAQKQIFVPDNNATTGGSNAIPFWAEWSAIQGEVRFQELYTPADLGNTPGAITEIAFAPNYTGTFGASLLEVRMSHSTLPSLVQTMDNNLPSPTTVLSGTHTFNVTQGQWAPVGITGSFAYNGVDNLVVEVRYKGGKTTFVSGTQGRFRSAPINRSWAYKNFNAPMWSGSDKLAGLKTRFTINDALVAASGSPSIGGSIQFALTASGDAGLIYQLGTSLGTGPTPIDTRQLGLTVDNMLIASTGGQLPSVFQSYAGVLNATGRAGATLNIPNIPQLVGVRLHNAFLTLQASAPSGVKSISNTASFSITT